MVSLLGSSLIIDAHKSSSGFIHGALHACHELLIDFKQKNSELKVISLGIHIYRHTYTELCSLLECLWWYDSQSKKEKKKKKEDHFPVGKKITRK